MNDTLTTVAGVLAVAFSLIAFNGVHQVREGHMAVYWRGGALLNDTAGPGYHVKVPGLDNFAEVQVTLQTDSVENIACGTSGGVTVFFDRIEVVNRLRQDAVLATVRAYGINYDKIWIFDKIHHEVNQFCSKHSLQEVYIDKFDQLDEQLQRALQESCTEFDTGVSIIAVRVTKPRIPTEIMRNFEAVEAEKTRLKIARERHQVVIAEAETESQRLKIEAEREKMVREINMERHVMEQKKEAEMDQIKSEQLAKRIEAQADADAYAARKLADANALLLTPQYLALQMYTALANNSKVFFGDKIPLMFQSLTPDLVHGGA